MNKGTIPIITNKEVEGFKEPALIAESEDTCPKIVEDPEMITTRITTIGIITEIETGIIMVEDGITITVDSKIGTIRTTGIITPHNNSNNSNNSSNRIIIRLTTFR